MNQHEICKRSLQDEEKSLFKLALAITIFLWVVPKSIGKMDRFYRLVIIANTEN